MPKAQGEDRDLDFPIVRYDRRLGRAYSPLPLYRVGTIFAEWGAVVDDTLFLIPSGEAANASLPKPRIRV